MKSTIYLFTLAIATLCYSCNMKTENVSITSDISIKFPTDYTLKDQNHSSGIISYEAKIKEGKLLAAIVPVPGLDTLDSNQKQEWLRENIQGYINGFSGEQISISDSDSEKFLRTKFIFEHSKNDASYISHSQMFITNDEMIVLMYETSKPETSQAIKEKDNFFKSLKIR